MIRLSMEIPTLYLDPWSKYCELDFALAHKVLADAAYREFYASREHGRELILDNSMHELGHPLPVTEIMHAAHLCKATYVVAPDQLGEPEQNLQWLRETHMAAGRNFFIAATLAGRTPQERTEYVRKLYQLNVGMVCFPFKEPRLDWYEEQKTNLRWCRRFHLFGVNTLEELSEFNRRYSAEARWSVDTCKPIKWGLLRETINRRDLRGAGSSNAVLAIDKPLHKWQEACIILNIRQLRKVCA